MTHTEHTTQIKTSDFEAFVSDVAAAIWNQLIENPSFDGLKLRDFPEIFEAVARTLHPYQGKKMLKAGDRVER